MFSKQKLKEICPKMVFDHEYSTVITVDLGDFGTIPARVSSGIKSWCGMSVVYILEVEASLPLAGTNQTVICNLEPMLGSFARSDMMDEVLNKFTIEREKNERP